MADEAGASQGASIAGGSSGLRDVALTFGSRIATMLVMFVGEAIRARILGPDGRGSYAVCTVFAGILTVVFMLGADAGSLYYVAARKFSAGQGLVHICLFGFAGGLIAIAAGLAAMHLPLEFFTKASPQAFYLALATVPISFVAGTLAVMPTSLRDFGLYAAISIVVSCVQVVNLVLFMWVLPWGVSGALAAILASNVIGTALVVAFLKRRHAMKWEPPTRESVGLVLSFGTRYYFGKISNLLNVQLGTLFLAMFASQDDIGLFSFAMTLVVGVTMIPDTLTTVMLPRVAADEKGRVDLVMLCTRLTGVICAAALVALAVLSWPFCALVVPKFTPAVAIIWALVPGIWLTATSKLVVPYLQRQNRVGVVSAAVALGMVVNLGLLVGLLPVVGLIAAAIAVGGNYLVSAVILAAVFRRVSGKGLRETWLPRWTDVRLFVDMLKDFLRRLRPAGVK